MYALKRLEDLDKIILNEKFNILFYCFLLDLFTKIFKNKSQFRDEIEFKFKESFGTKDHKKIQDMTDTMLKCLKPKFKHLLSVCYNYEIDLAILNVLLQAVKSYDPKLTSKSLQKKGQFFSLHIDNDNRHQNQLHLALDWNRSDLARKFIFTDELSDKVSQILNSYLRIK